MSKKELKVCWLSAGVSSFIAGYLKRDSIDLYIYIDIENQHPDSMRFIKDCEKILGKEIQILKSPYRNKENVIRQFRYWYWNQIRKYFPEVFQTMAELEREIGHSCINGVFLDELDPERGRKEDEISFDCGIFCHLFFLENQEGQKDEPTKEE